MSNLYNNEKYLYNSYNKIERFKMVAWTTEPCDRSYSVLLNADTNSAMECVNCVLKQRQIDDILSQLKSLQIVIDTLKRTLLMNTGRISATR
jgi:hypothetical protein